MAAVLRFGGDADATRREVAKFSPRDADALGAYYARLDRLADQLKKWVLRAPPNLGGPLVVQGLRDAAAAARLLLDFGALPTGGKRDLIDVFTKSAGQWLDASFESEPLKAVLGWDSVVGNYASPYAAGSAYVLLHHCFGEVNGKAGRWGHAIGGMGADHRVDGRRSACARRAYRCGPRVRRACWSSTVRRSVC